MNLSRQSPGSTATVPTSPDDRATTFRPVEGGSEMQSGEKLLVEAYAAMMMILFVFVYLSWRRQQRIDRRIDDLEGSLERARGKAGTGAE